MVTDSLSPLENEVDPVDDRTGYALDRTVLANERIYAAWIRTGFTALAAGVAIEKFMDGAIPVFLALTEDQTPDQKTRCARVAPFALAVTLIAAIWGGEPLLQFSGVNIATRLMGLILAAIAVEFIAQGLVDLFPALAQRG